MSKLSKNHYDVVVVGGGVKGCAIARDATGRGLRVLLCEKDDLCSNYVKSIIRFGMEQCEVSPTFNRNEAKLAHQEWKILRRTVPQLLRASNLQDGANPNMLMPQIPTSGETDGTPLRGGMTDHRFALLNARDAAERGATILPHTAFLGATRAEGRWAVQLLPRGAIQPENISAMVIVDTAGFFPVTTENPASGLTGYLAAAILCEPNSERAAFAAQTKQSGSYFSVASTPGLRLTGLQFQTDQTLGPSDIKERLCQAISVHEGTSDSAPRIQWFDWEKGQTEPFTSASVAEFNAFQITINTPENPLPIIQVHGGSLSATRKIAEDVVAEMAPYVRMIGKYWTRTAPLPGGDFQIELREDIVAQFIEKYNFLPKEAVRRMFDDHGTDVSQILQGVTCRQDLGRDFGAGLFESEVRWLLEHEWAQSAADIVWRRTRLGSQLSPEQIGGLDTWMAESLRPN